MGGGDAMVLVGYLAGTAARSPLRGPVVDLDIPAVQCEGIPPRLGIIRVQLRIEAAQCVWHLSSPIWSGQSPGLPICARKASTVLPCGAPSYPGVYPLVFAALGRL